MAFKGSQYKYTAKLTTENLDYRHLASASFFISIKHNNYSLGSQGL
jgi:hypothetical protein